MTLRKQLKQAWDALADANLGEFLPYADKCRALGVEPPPNGHGYLPPAEVAPRRCVALNLGPGLDAAALDYAIGTAQRLEAGLIFLRHATDAQAQIPDWLTARCADAGIAWDQEVLSAPWVESVAAFLRHRPDVVCLVLAPADLDPRMLPKSKPPGRRWAFPAPVVVVGEAPLPNPT